MIRRFAGVLLLVMLPGFSGCGSQSQTRAATPVIDAEKANAEVAGYVKLAREYLGRREFDKAVQTLERAVTLDSATDKREATELLASVLPLSKTGLPKSTKTERYASSMGPVEVIQGYLSSPTWQERVPFVLRPAESGPQMATVYKNQGFDPTAFRPGTIVPLERESVPVGSKVTVTVDVSESSPENPYWRYVVEHTKDGYKIDWQASQALKWAEEEAAARRALQLEKPELQVRLLKTEPQGDYVYLHFRVTNCSNKYISNWSMSVEMTNSAGEYVGEEYMGGSNLPAGESCIEKKIVKSEIAGQTAARKYKPKHIFVNVGGKNTSDATKFFTVSVVK